MRSNTSRTGCFITIVAHNRAYFYIDRGASLVIPYRRNEIARNTDATHRRVTATLDPRHERQAFFWPVLAIFWPTFLRFRTWVIRHRYWYWWHMNETRSAFVEPDVTHHFVMGYRTFMSSSLKLHCFFFVEKAVRACNALRNRWKTERFFAGHSLAFHIISIFSYIFSET